MAARSIRNAVLRLGDEEVPVKLYAAVEDRDVHLHLLHDQDLSRVEQRLVDPRTDEEVPPEERRRGVEVASGRFVVVGEDELDELAPDASRDLRVLQALPRGTIDHRWYERPYYVGPDGDDDAYFALAQALEQRDLECVTRWAMRNKDYVGALRAEDGYLKLIALRHAGELIPADAITPPRGRKAEPQELKMAEQLVEALAAEPDLDGYRDRLRERVLELVESKRDGEDVVPIEDEPPAPSDDGSLKRLLQESLAQAGRGGA